MALLLFPRISILTSYRLGILELSNLITSNLSYGAPLGNLGGMALPPITVSFHSTGLVMRCRNSVRHQQLAVFIKSPYVHQTLSSCCPLLYCSVSFVHELVAQRHVSFISAFPVRSTPTIQ